MKYHNITTNDMLNGDGLRVVLWVAGCNHFCKNCHNPETWDPDSGLLFGNAEMNEIRKELDKEYISGLTFSGGDPLYPDNREKVTKIAKAIKKEFPNKTIWLYTGYQYEKVCNVEIMQYIDVLCDGEFVEELADINNPWVGSKNQRVIDVKTTREAEKIILHESK